MRLVSFLSWRLPVFLLVLTNRRTAYANDSNDDDGVDEEFFDACTRGEVDEVQAMLKAHPDWLNAKKNEEETCLHLAAIPGSSALTRMLLEAGADPNVRTGLRMHPLSWNVYGGHYESVQLLLDHGADVNADVDHVLNPDEPVTVLDIVTQLLPPPDEEPGDSHTLDDKWFQIQTILLKHGAQTYEQTLSILENGEKEDEFEEEAQEDEKIPLIDKEL